ncbi:MAG: tRNA (adenosine(37)-N6)-threonylcarbamoyltransferase complex transferase subunit TsaD [Candidatus Omnitrophica bacterium]|nr:tRNA (adenosine(37)-N6)-threonylcarbamoyltransferase complex transferase subunit TsaD [Candidatus Omnitrophota bacterium]
MITLGIETSCDETGVAVVKDNRILSNVVASSMHLHKRYGGVVPEIATRYHVEVINYCLKDALKKANASLKDIDLISVTQGPGLIGALLIGICFAKALGFSLGVPVIGANHIIAHLWANFLTADKPATPYIGLAVSGGHTSLILVRGPGSYSVLGQTLDDAAGEAFDKVAKILNLGYPGGPAIEKSAKRKTRNIKRLKFSLPSCGDSSLDFSFSGIKTAVLYHVKNNGGVEKLDKGQIAEIARAFQETVCDALVNRAISACKSKKIKRLVVGGGVSANTRLREKLDAAASSNGIKIFIPPPGLCVDNAAMTAVLGAALFRKGMRSDEYMSGFANFDMSPAAS